MNGYCTLRQVRVEGMEVDEDAGALVVYDKPEGRGSQIKIHHEETCLCDIYANVVGRRVDGEEIYAAIFPKLRPGRYFVSGGADNHAMYVNVFAGQLAEVDWR